MEPANSLRCSQETAAALYLSQLNADHTLSSFLLKDRH